MTEQEYLSAVEQIRVDIKDGGARLQRAEEALAGLRRIFPKRLPYLCAEIELLLAKGEDRERCRNAIDYVLQEFYPQEGVSDLLALKGSTFSEDTPEWRQLQFLLDVYRTEGMPEQPFVQLDAMKRQFLAGNGDAEELHALAEQYYVTRNTLLSAVLMMAWCRQTGRMEHYEDHVLLDAGQPHLHPVFHGNFTYLARMMTDGGRYTFLLVDDAAGDHADMEILADALAMLGQQAILLRESGAVREACDADACAQECIQAAEISRGHIIVATTQCRTASGTVVDVTPAVIRLLARSIVQEAPLIVFARDVRMGELHRKTALGGDIQRLSHCLPPRFSYGLSFAWAGDYLRYASYLYGESVEELLAAPASCDFSIVIPVCGVSDTLPYTLQTCLSLDYEGSYEIVLSDNSDDGCTAVRDLCAEIGDPRIRYYKTPRVLYLDKSFEYAFLHARGAFILSIGADDGICPWALRYLDKALAAHPDEPLFGWKRGLYTWQGLLPHERSFLQIFLHDPNASSLYARMGLSSCQDEVIAHIDDVFYHLPVLYINSGFRRSYLRTLLHRTGRLLDGCSQDLYMGTVNFLLNDHFIRIDAPLTFAGMSGKSIGAGTQRYHSDVDAAAFAGMHKKRVHEQTGEYVPRDAEYRVPCIDTAGMYGFYATILRLQEMGATDTELSWNGLFDHLVQNMYVSDIRLERFFGTFLYAASLCGGQTYEPCRAFYASVCAEPKMVESPEAEFFSDYRLGYDATYQKLTLDAHAFDCHNIADAVSITARILNL